MDPVANIGSWSYNLAIVVLGSRPRIFLSQSRCEHNPPDIPNRPRYEEAFFSKTLPGNARDVRFMGLLQVAARQVMASGSLLKKE